MYVYKFIVTGHKNSQVRLIALDCYCICLLQNVLLILNVPSKGLSKLQFLLMQKQNDSI